MNRKSRAEAMRFAIAVLPAPEVRNNHDPHLAFCSVQCPDSEVRIIARHTRLRTSESKGH